jgi:hypothetical protein
MRRTPNGGLYDRPLHKDWLAWLTALVLIASLVGTVADEYLEPTPDPFDLAIKLPLALAVAWALFILLPGLIRRLVRRNPPQTKGGLYDRPLWKDWLTWLSGYGFFTGLLAFGLLFGDPDSASANTAQLAIGLVLSLAVSLAMFGLVPGLIRRRIRKRLAAVIRSASRDQT